MGLIPSPRTIRGIGVSRMLRGMRDGDQQALVLGAGLFAYAWLRLNKDPEKTLLFRKTVPEGSGIVIRSGKPGELPFIDITKL